MELNFSSPRIRQIILRGQVSALEAALHSGALPAAQVRERAFEIMNSEPYKAAATPQIKADLTQVVKAALASDGGMKN